LPNEGGSLKTNLVRVLSRGKLCDDRDATNEAQILLDFNIIKNDLSILC